jgi:hypothetical protein
LFSWLSLYILGTDCMENTASNIFIVMCVFIATGMCLPSRCLAVDVFSVSPIPAVRRHVTVSPPS